MPDVHPDAAQLQSFLHACTAARVAAVPCGPFSLYPDPHERKTPFLNYAIPAVRGDGPTFAAAIPALVAAFRERGLMPALEFVEGAAPSLTGALEAAGFVREPASFAMVCAPNELVMPPRAADVVHLAADAPEDAMHGAIVVRKKAFEDSDAPPTLAEIAAFRAAPPAWNHAVLAVDGTIVAAGSLSAVHAGWAEVAGIATDAAHRRRGYANAVTAALARRAFEAGAATVFLTAGDRDAASVYRRAGFRPSPLVVAAYRLPPE